MVDGCAGGEEGARGWGFFVGREGERRVVGARRVRSSRRCPFGEAQGRVWAEGELALAGIQHGGVWERGRFGTATSLQISKISYPSR